MPYEHTFPGQPLAIKSSDWNAAMDAARAVASGETGLRAQRSSGDESNTIPLVKNTSGGDLRRFDVVDIDEAVFSADDNENGYKGGPQLKATGVPVGGRLAFCGVVQETIAAGKFGRVAMAGVTVGYVTGDGKYAWPVEGDKNAFESRDTGGFPIYDRGTADEDGYSLATILLTPTTGSGDGQSSGLPSDATGCGCTECIEGTASHDCEDCGCINKTLMVSMPGIKLPNGTSWDVSGIERVRYDKTIERSGKHCVHVSQAIDGPSCTVDDVEVHDEYRLEADYSAGTAELVCITEEPQCPVRYVKWCIVGCARKCTCPRRYEVSEFENVQHPGSCNLCLTPVAKRLFTVCDRITEFPEVIRLTIPALEPDPEAEFGPCEGTTTAPEETVELYFDSQSESAITYKGTYDSPDVDVCTGEYGIELVFQCAGNIQMAIKTPPSGSNCYGRDYFGTFVEGETSWTVTFDDDSGDTCYLWPEDIALSGGQIVARSSGHLGSGCGSETVCDSEECVLEVASYGSGKRWIVALADSTCSSECENNCNAAPTCNEVDHPTCGDANDFDIGDKCNAGPCTPFSESPTTIVLSFAPTDGDSCACGTFDHVFCFDESTSRYEATVHICGSVLSCEYYEYEGNWYLDLGGALANNSDPAGPFLTSFMEDDPLCEGLSVTVDL
jgi:hypothetical protein